MTNHMTNSELEHDRWFRHQVQSAQKRIASGEAKLIPHDEFWREIDAYSRQLVEREGAAVKENCASQ